MGHAFTFSIRKAGLQANRGPKNLHNHPLLLLLKGLVKLTKSDPLSFVLSTTTNTIHSRTFTEQYKKASLMTSENANQTESVESDSKRTKELSVPPEGYVCKVCGVPGHWIQQCTEKKHNKKRKKNPNHEYRPGVDPSPKDIEEAKQMQAIVPPPCDCGIKSRVKKVKRSKVTANSRANGSYFFFCSKHKDDVTKCNFAQPVTEIQKTEKDKLQANFFAKKRKGLVK